MNIADDASSELYIHVYLLSENPHLIYDETQDATGNQVQVRIESKRSKTAFCAIAGASSFVFASITLTVAKHPDLETVDSSGKLSVPHLVVSTPEVLPTNLVAIHLKFFTSFPQALIELKLMLTVKPVGTIGEEVPPERYVERKSRMREL